MKRNIFLQAFSAELADDMTAFRFYDRLSEEQKEDVLDYVRRSRDEEEILARSATALERLRAGRIDFV